MINILNPQQLKAVQHDKGPLLILAGAGSGKTRVLTYRIAYLIDEIGVNPFNILAITFTNKATNEMKERIDKIVGYGSEHIWVSTFHSTCVRILRRYIDTLGYNKNFIIYDTDDQKTLMKDICEYLKFDTKNIKERTILSEISNAKNEFISPEKYIKLTNGDYKKENFAKAYIEYQKRLKANNALDFDDLIFKTIELFEQNEEALNYYRNRFKYILVDEYQDTNTAQFKFISMLAYNVNEYGEVEHNLCVVGDDDQSIYKFRGANIYNILNFENEYPETKVIKLEQNYRSTQNILNTANAVISHNKGRKRKKLWTENEEGDKINFTIYPNGIEEAIGIVNNIIKRVKDGEGYDEFVILYRTNAQSRIFEEELVRKGVPYKIIGAINFYQRKEIKDLLAYLKTIENGYDDLSVKRIINVPRRGIGATTIEKVSNYAISNGIGFYEALQKAEYIPNIKRGLDKIKSFVSFIESLKSKLNSGIFSIRDVLSEIIDNTNYIEEIKESDDENKEDRLANIDEFVAKLASYEENCMEMPTLSGFLEEIALVAGIDELENEKERVVLMTIHSAKGLEFPTVYLCGMEEGIFPSYISINADDPESEIEEERRLCYVGITRAMKNLYLSCANQRMIRGETWQQKPSRFLDEIPKELLNLNSTGFSFNYKKDERAIKLPLDNNPYIQKGVNNLKFNIKNVYNYKKTNDNNINDINYNVGDSVKHIKFGVGKVLEMTPKDNDFVVKVDFGMKGIKIMKASFAKFQKL